MKQSAFFVSNILPFNGDFSIILKISDREKRGRGNKHVALNYAFSISIILWIIFDWQKKETTKP